jgi:hypothetical protein
MGFTLGTEETILAPKTPAEMLPLLALSGLKVLEVSDDENPKLPLQSNDLEDAGFRVFEGVGVVRVLERDVAAAMCFQ